MKHVQVLLKKSLNTNFFRFVFLEALSLFLFIVCADIHTTKYYWFIDNFAAFKMLALLLTFF